MLHASFDPHASALLRLEKFVGAGAGVCFGAAEGAGVERLKAEYDGVGAGTDTDGGALTTGVARGAGAGPDRSKRSPIVEVGGGGDLAVLAVGVADVKSPKSPNPLDMLCMCDFVGGGGLLFAAGASLLSKKPPPLENVGEVIEGWRVAAGEERLENAAGLDAGCC